MEKVFGVINGKTEEISCINFTCGQFADEVTLCLGKEYEVRFENGKTIVAKKKPKYPKTFEGCSSVINEKCAFGIGGYKGIRLYELQCLLICRDAYWKIAGEEMGLDGPWEPDWTSGKPFYCISVSGNIIGKGKWYTDNKILAFPTEEMRDAFYDNFKELINSCKELL